MRSYAYTHTRTHAPTTLLHHISGIIIQVVLREKYILVISFCSFLKNIEYQKKVWNVFSIYIFENSEFDKHQFTKETMTLIHVRNTKNAFQTDFIFSLKIRQRLYFNTDLYSVHRSSSDDNLPSLTICKSPFFSKGAVVKIFVYVETAGSL